MSVAYKILIHSDKIIEVSLLRIGQMSEEAQESCNKFIKNNRQNLARKCSRIQNMGDVIHRLLVSSDPLISSLRKLASKQLKATDAEAVDILKALTSEFQSSAVSKFQHTQINIPRYWDQIIVGHCYQLVPRYQYLVIIKLHQQICIR